MKKNKMIPLVGMVIAIGGLTIVPHQSLAIANNTINTQEDSIAICQGDFFYSIWRC